MIDRDLAGFLQQGLAIHVGVRDEHLQPEGGRGVAVHVEPDGRHLVVFLSTAAAARLLPHLRTNAQAAIAFVRPVDDRAVQVKGTAVADREADADERELVQAQWNGFRDQLERIGIPRATSEGWSWWPAVAIRVRATAIFDQTPGEKAGTPLR